MATGERRFVTENGLEFLARVSVKTTEVGFREKFLFPLRFGDVVEVYGPPGSGKSLLLLNTIAQAILPTNLGAFAVGGSGVEVLLVTCTCSFNIMRLITILETRITSAIIDSSPSLTQLSSLTTVESGIEDSLSRLQICRCNDFTQLVATLASFDEVLWQRPQMRFLIIEMSMLFLWPNEVENGDEANKMTFLKMLKAVTRRYRLATLVTNTDVQVGPRKREPPKTFSSAVSSQFDGRIDCRVSNTSFHLKLGDSTLEKFKINEQGLMTK